MSLNWDKYKPNFTRDLTSEELELIKKHHNAHFPKFLRIPQTPLICGISNPRKGLLVYGGVAATLIATGFYDEYVDEKRRCLKVGDEVDTNAPAYIAAGAIGWRLVVGSIAYAYRIKRNAALVWRLQTAFPTPKPGYHYTFGHRPKPAGFDSPFHSY